MDFAYWSLIALLIFGFGFVIFFHELGHFLAAKWAGVEVEQFAVGFGHAIVSWRRGLGARMGSSRQEYETRVQEYLKQNEVAINAMPQMASASEKNRLDYVAAKLGLAPTEYRLNWFPLGGYVKMLGQDDLDPNAKSDSPNAYNNKSILKRMVIVSAGVIMNVILAIILFTLLFRFGFTAPPAVVGTVLTGSPAQQAGLQVGDRILTFDGRWQPDFTKISLNVALVEKGVPILMHVRHPDGTEKDLTVTPRQSDIDSLGVLQLGIFPSRELRGLEGSKLTADDLKELKDTVVKPDETVIAVNGQKVDFKTDYYILDRAVQTGLPVQITVRDPQGKEDQREVIPGFAPRFDKTAVNFAGLTPRSTVDGIRPDSPAKDKLQKGDIIEQITLQPANDPIPHPTVPTLMTKLNEAGQNHMKVDVLVMRDGKELQVPGLEPSLRVAQDRRGLGIELNLDEEHPVVAEVLPDSPAQRAGIEPGSTIKSIDGKPVNNWRDVQRMLAAASSEKPVNISVQPPQGQAKDVQLQLNPEQIAQVADQRYTVDVALRELTEVRRTTNPIEAARWGLGETRDLIVQFYITIRRMVQGSIAASNAMGPVGIVATGSKFANRGLDWVTWFLAMISANLAVVNFLPIPIVDGGLFLFLILEKIMGKPLSPRAQGIAQMVGLALIGGVFLFVTYHDITQHLGIF